MSVCLCYCAVTCPSQLQLWSSHSTPDVQGKKRQEHFKALIKRYMLRRTKEGTIKEQLPSKTDTIVFCPLAPIQMRAYRRARARLSHTHLLWAQQCCLGAQFA